MAKVDVTVTQGAESVTLTDAFEYELPAASVDISSATDDGVRFDVSSEDSQAKGLTFKSDGTKMYYVGRSGNKIYQYSLSAAWDVSTASYDSVSVSLSGVDTNTEEVEFKSDGTKVYVVGTATKKVHQCSLSPAWDLSSLSADGVTYDLNAQNPDIDNPSGLSFSPDGQKLYVCDFFQAFAVFEYTLSTPWDLSTAAYSGNSLDVSTEESAIKDCVIAPDGLTLLITGSGDDKIFQYDLGTAFDLSTAAYNSVSVNGVSGHINMEGLAIRTDTGGKMYYLSGSEAVVQFTL